MKIARKAQTCRRRQTIDCSDSWVCFRLGEWPDRERNTNGSQRFLEMSWAARGWGRGEYDFYYYTADAEQ
jgi:hypothetical protein